MRDGGGMAGSAPEGGSGRPDREAGGAGGWGPAVRSAPRAQGGEGLASWRLAMGRRDGEREEGSPSRGGGGGAKLRGGSLNSRGGRRQT